MPGYGDDGGRGDRPDETERQRRLSLDRRLNEGFAEIRRDLAVLKEEYQRRQGRRDLVADFGRWLGYIGALFAIFGAVVAAVLWISRHGG